MTEEEFYETAPLKRRTYLLLFVLLGGLASLAAVGKVLYDGQASDGFCQADGLVLGDDSGDRYRRDPQNGCRWVDNNGDFLYPCPESQADCSWLDEVRP